MTRRLLLSYLSVVLVVLVLLEIPLAVLADRHERGLLQTQATEEATSFAVLAAVGQQSGQPGALQQLVEQYHGQAGGEVLVAGPSGQLTASSERDGRADLAGLQPLVAAARQGRDVNGWHTDEGGRQYAVAVVPLRATVTAPNVEGAVVLFLPADTAIDRIHEVWVALGIFAVAVLALTFVLGATIARGLSRPVAALSTAVKRLGAGNLSERAPAEGPSELRALATEFNRMAERIEQLVTVQTRFVADASHQLRSPLTALRLRLENLEVALEDGSQSGAGDGTAASVAAAGREVQRLSRLVDGLLTLTRTERTTPRPQPVDVAAVIGERMEAWRPLAEERGVALEADTTTIGRSEVPLVAGDLEQILDNLLGNALDATPAGGHVAIESSASASGIDVSVVDDGPGMSADERARAFDRFWQGAGHRGGSSGLGLAIVAQLAQRNQAVIELHEARPDRRATTPPGQPGGAAGPDTGGIPAVGAPPPAPASGHPPPRRPPPGGTGWRPARSPGRACAPCSISATEPRRLPWQHSLRPTAHSDPTGLPWQAMVVDPASGAGAEAPTPGPLALVGGEAWQEGCDFDAELLQAMHAEAPDGAAEVLVVPAAAAYEHPQRSVDAARKWFAGLGAEVRELPVLSRADAEAEVHAEVARRARFIYLGDGSPLHLRSVLKDSVVWNAMVAAWRDGAVLAGSGAGAMVFGNTMVDPRGGALTLGLGLVSGLAVLPHADTWSHEKAQRTVELATGHLRIVAVDERSALVRDPSGRWHAKGAGRVTVFLDGHPAGLDSLPAGPDAFPAPAAGTAAAE